MAYVQGRALRRVCRVQHKERDILPVRPQMECNSIRSIDFSSIPTVQDLRKPRVHQSWKVGASMREVHECNYFCMCPVHKIAFLYSKSENLHACKLITCEYAHGYENVVMPWSDPSSNPLKDIQEHLRKEREKPWRSIG